MILQDRGHPAQTSRPREQAAVRERENFPGWISALEPFPFHNIPAAPGAGSGDESLVGIHVPVYRTQTACGCADPILAICRLDAPRTLRAPSACQQYLGQEQQPAGYSARGPESHGLLPLGSPFSPAGPSFNKGRKLGKRVACIRHHRMRISATIFYSSGTLAGHRRCVIRPEARGAGATRIPTASNQTRDQG